MPYSMKRVVVIGSGTMGGAIAAHVANAGIPVYLLDIAPDRLTPEEQQKGLTLESPAVRNRIVRQGWERVLKARPPALFSSRCAELVTLGNLEDNFGWLAEADWIVEAVVENLEIKQRLMARIDEVRRPDAIVTTNTSGIPIHQIAENRSESFRRHFFGTHFFNPPRYMRLLEIIPTSDTDLQILAFFRDFAERMLGKGVVLAKDRPNFIANRLGTFAALWTIKQAMEHDYTVEEVDALTGTVLGRPKSATFRLLDMVGVDIMGYVAKNLYPAVPDDEQREVLQVPAPIAALMERGWLGDKSGQGFYKKVQGEGGQREFWALDLKTLEHRPPQKADLPMLKQAKKIDDLGERLRFLMSQRDDRAGRFVEAILLPTLAYTARRIPEISDSLVDVDNAMKWGFNHEQGPFETWDAIGVPESLERMKELGIAVAPWVEKMLECGYTSFYRREGARRLVYSPVQGGYEPIPERQGVIELNERRRLGSEIARNDSASLIDLGDGVLCLEFHSKMNTLDLEIIDMARRALEELEKDRWVGLVIGNQGSDFSVGANAFLFLMAVQSGQLNLLEQQSQTMHSLLQAIRFSPKPVVTAPFGRTLGGGVEVVLHGSRICAAAETYMGLVEVGLGIIPGAGGCKEMVRRVLSPAMQVPNTDPLPHLQRIFETLGMAKVAGSAEEARELGFLSEADRIEMNSDRLIGSAKQFVLDLVDAGYKPPVRGKNCYAVGREGFAALEVGIYLLKQGGYISEYDAHVGKKLAYVLSGGDLSSPQWVSEEYFLELERETFLSLLGEQKTIERITYMLQHGKPLRN